MSDKPHGIIRYGCKQVIGSCYMPIPNEEVQLHYENTGSLYPDNWKRMEN